MQLFPINLNISGKAVVVVGGGAVACRKCRLLLDAGARVTVISPRLEPALADAAKEGKIAYLAREYREGDLAGAFLVFAATDDASANSAVAREAEARGILANVADDPQSGGFTLPSSLRRGDLIITVSTAGKSPALARAVRRQLEPQFGAEYLLTLDLLGKVREKLLTGGGDSAYNNKILNELVAQDLPTLFRTHAFADIDHHLLRLFGAGFSLADLGVRERDPL
ncbi:MAG TPA: bifunctional precorrin-2 dehydrogenase/sirohydrochlorin ferrochelatase [Geobacteraceae bacterium]